MRYRLEETPMLRHSILLISTVALTAFGCGEGTTGGTQDATVQTDAVSLDTSTGDVEKDTTVNDTGTIDTHVDVTEDVIEDIAVDSNTQDTGLEDIGEDTGSMDILTDTETPEDIAEDIQEDIEEDIPMPPFDQPIEISNGTDYESGELHAMTVNDFGNVSIFWRGSMNDDSVDLLVSPSDPTASAFYPPVVVKADLEKQGVGVGGDMLQNQNTFYLVWRDITDNGDHIVTFRRSTSQDFSGEDVVVDSAPKPIALWRPQLMRSIGGTVCVIWERKAGQDFNVWLRCSLDDGLTWQESVQVDDPAGQSATVSSATFNTAGSLVVAVQVTEAGKQHIMVKVSDDLGVTWTKATTVDGMAISNGLVSESLNDSGNLKPSLVHTMTGKLKLAWHKPLAGGTAESYLSSSSDGLAWTTPSLMPNGKANIGLVRGRGSDLHASSVESILGQGDTLYMSSPDEGDNWGPSNPIPKTMNSTLIDHRMCANLVEGWLYIAWWETLPGNLLKQKLLLMTIGGP